MIFTPTKNFSPPEMDSHGTFYWMTADMGEIDLHGGCDPCDGIVRMTIEPFDGSPRTVIIEGGRQPVRVQLNGSAECRIPVRLDEGGVLKLTSSPGAEPVTSAFPSSTDPRSLALRVRDPRFVPTP